MKPPGIQPHDRLLVERSLCGDEAAYGSLIERYGSIVRGIALYQGAREDADDVTQEVFLRAWSALSQLERADRFGPWVAQIARNTGHAWRHRRRLRSDAESSAGYRLLPDTPPTPG